MMFRASRDAGEDVAPEGVVANSAPVDPAVGTRIDIVPDPTGLQRNPSGPGRTESAVSTLTRGSGVVRGGIDSRHPDSFSSQSGDVASTPTRAFARSKRQVAPRSEGTGRDERGEDDQRRDDDRGCDDDRRGATGHERGSSIAEVTPTALDPRATAANSTVDPPPERFPAVRVLGPSDLPLPTRSRVPAGAAVGASGAELRMEEGADPRSLEYVSLEPAPTFGSPPGPSVPLGPDLRDSPWPTRSAIAASRADLGSPPPAAMGVSTDSVTNLADGVELVFDELAERLERAAREAGILAAS